MRLQPTRARQGSSSARAAIIGISAVLVLAGCGLTDAREAAVADAKVTPNNMDNSLRPGLVGMPDYPSSGWEPSAGVGAIKPSDIPSHTTQA